MVNPLVWLSPKPLLLARLPVAKKYSTSLPMSILAIAPVATRANHSGSARSAPCGRSSNSRSTARLASPRASRSFSRTNVWMSSPGSKISWCMFESGLSGAQYPVTSAYSFCIMNTSRLNLSSLSVGGMCTKMCSASRRSPTRSFVSHGSASSCARKCSPRYASACAGVRAPSAAVSSSTIVARSPANARAPFPGVPLAINSATSRSDVFASARTIRPAGMKYSWRRNTKATRAPPSDK